MESVSLQLFPEHLNEEGFMKCRIKTPMLLTSFTFSTYSLDIQFTIFRQVCHSSILCCIDWIVFNCFSKYPFFQKMFPERQYKIWLAILFLFPVSIKSTYTYITFVFTFLTMLLYTSKWSVKYRKKDLAISIWSSSFNIFQLIT